MGMGTIGIAWVPWDSHGNGIAAIRVYHERHLKKGVVLPLAIVEKG